MAPLPNEDRDGAGDGQVLGVVDARQATKTSYMPRILAISVGLSVLVLAGAWALTAHKMDHAHGGNVQVTPAAPPSGKSQAAGQGKGPAVVSATRS